MPGRWRGKGLGAVGMDLGLVAGASSGSAGGVGGALVGVVGRGSAVALGGVLGRVALGPEGTQGDWQRSKKHSQ